MSRTGAFLALVLVLGAAARAQDRPSGEVRLLFTGDILLSRQVQRELERRKVSPWAAMAELFQHADWVGGNFEGAVGPASGCLPSANPCFAAPESSIELIRQAGFRALTIENNHAGDLGAAAREQTLAAFRESGILALDFDSSPQFLRFGNTTVGLVAIATVKGADGRAQRIPSIEVAQKLRLASALANLVVVSIHWGTELLDWPSAAQREQAAWLVAHGAGLILGHHPHVVQAPACIGGHPVFFSLGNHVFDQKYPETKAGLIADCRISGRRLRCSGIPTHTDPGTSMPELVQRPRGAVDSLASCAPELGAGLQIGGTTIKPEPWAPGQPSEGLVLDGWKNGELKWRSRRQRLVALEAAPLAGRDHDLLLFTLERHASPIDHEVGIRPYVYAVGAHGLIAQWRGSALAWPLLDAVVDRDGTLCALHRGDSFVALDPSQATTRVARYRWNGFGFTGGEGQPADKCERLFR